MGRCACRELALPLLFAAPDAGPKFLSQLTPQPRLARPSAVHCLPPVDQLAVSPLAFQIIQRQPALLRLLHPTQGPTPWRQLAPPLGWSARSTPTLVCWPPPLPLPPPPIPPPPTPPPTHRQLVVAPGLSDNSVSQSVNDQHVPPPPCPPMQAADGLHRCLPAQVKKVVGGRQAQPQRPPHQLRAGAG